jgi:hypothetical protein
MTLVIEQGRLADWSPASSQTFAWPSLAHDALAARVTEACARYRVRLGSERN